MVVSIFYTNDYLTISNRSQTSEPSKVHSKPLGHLHVEWWQKCNSRVIETHNRFRNDRSNKLQHRFRIFCGPNDFQPITYQFHISLKPKIFFVIFQHRLEAGILLSNFQLDNVH